VSVFGNFTISLAVALIFWNPAHTFLVPWTSTLWTLSCFAMLLWQLHRREPVLVSRQAVWWLTAGIGLSALLYALMFVRLFAVTGDQDRLTLVAAAAGCIAVGGWLFASLPQAGVAWVVIFCGSVAVGLSARHWETHAPLVGLLASYALILVAAVLVTSRLFLGSLKAESELERQRQLVGLLLRDFEEHASDWLWETDRDGRLRHVSVRLAQAMGAAVDTLQGRSFVDVIGSLSNSARPQDRATIDQLRHCLTGSAAFANVVVPVQIAGDLRWWSLTAKPLPQAPSSEYGWRGVCTDITEAQRREMELARLATIDTLTGLANRHRFSVHTAAHFAAATASPCTLFLLDLDNFKTVNDSLGHAAGDELLKEVAQRLSRVVDPESLLARLGGDEFALFHPVGLSRRDAERYGARLQAALEQPWWVDEHRVDVRASIGVAVAPADGDTAEDLLKASDMALYAAKGVSRRTLRFFNRDMDRQAQHKLTLLGDMKDGLRRGEFRVVYQPQVDLASGRLAGFEALVRWRHEERGLVMPADFVPLAEESGLIVPLGDWVLQQACTDAATWPADLWVAVNVSAAQLACSGLEHSVSQALRRSGLGRRRLELELTESTFMRDSEPALSVLRSLRRSGVSITLDDFGTGYSSLSYLRQLPLDKLKIDRSFVRTLGGPTGGPSLAVARTIALLAQAMNFKTTAEGIETAGQRELLEQMGCTFGQGYLFARPLDAAQTAVYIEGYSPETNAAQA
jgi:diguanylate cyclase (GGDEF)-like protein/PAS domain S-box-containing protein